MTSSTSKTLRLQAVETGANPDAILYEPKGREVYAVNHTGHSVTVFAADTGKVRATIPLPGVGEFAVLDAERGQVFVNVEDTSQLVAIDTASHQVTATWPLAPGEEPTGLAFDPRTRHLFVACGNGKLAMIDAATGRVLASVPIGAGADGAAFDPGTGLAFASSSDGTLTVARPQGDTLSVVQTLSTPKRSRTMTLDPKTHRLYVSAAEFAPAGADGRRSACRSRPAVQGRGLRWLPPTLRSHAWLRPKFPRDQAGSSARHSRGPRQLSRQRERAKPALMFRRRSISRSRGTSTTWRPAGASRAGGRGRPASPNPDLAFESTKDTPHRMLARHPVRALERSARRRRL